MVKSTVKTVKADEKNATILKEKKKKPYRGVTYHKKNGKWIAQGSCNGKSKYLGTHDDPIVAAKVYDAYMYSMHGKKAKTNFPTTEVDYTIIPILRRYKCQAGFQQRQVQFNNMYGLDTPLLRYKRLRDPDEPKQPRNAYMFFIKEERAKVLNNPNTFQNDIDENQNNIHQMKLGITSKICGAKWRSMTDEEKVPYSDMAKRDKIRYQEEYGHYKTVLEQKRIKMIKDFNEQAAVMQASGRSNMMMPPQTNINLLNPLGKNSNNINELNCKPEKLNIMQQPVYMPMMHMQNIPSMMMPNMHQMNNLYNNTHLNNFNPIKTEQKKMEIQSSNTEILEIPKIKEL